MASDKRIGDVKEIEVKEINKRRSGEAFEVIIKHSDDNAVAQNPLKSPVLKKEPSMDEIQSRLQAAEERRKAKQNALRNQLKAEEEKVLKVKQKKAEADTSFSSSAEERLKVKMSTYEENYESALQAKIEKFRALNMKPEELKEKIQLVQDELRAQRDEVLQQKLTKSEQLRKQQLQSVREKQQEKENHAQQVRLNKQKYSIDGLVETD